MNQPVRGETDADATGTNHLHVTIGILWKTFELSSKRRYYAPLIDRKPKKYGIIRPIHSQAAHLHGRVARVSFFSQAAWRVIS
jgi:hypothetical protein